MAGKSDEIVILHISDLHFGIEKSDQRNGQIIAIRMQDVLTSLVHTLADESQVSSEWRPDVVVISGDIAFSGAAEEYQAYRDKFESLLMNKLDIDQRNIITCPGNHDVILDEARYTSRPQRKEFCDEDVPPLDGFGLKVYRKHFSGYISEMCAKDNKALCKSYTPEHWPWITFITLNSAWDCRGTGDEGRLRVGLHIFEELVSDVPKENVIVTIFHHPPEQVTDRRRGYGEDGGITEKVTDVEWLHLSEIAPEEEGQRCFRDYVEANSDFILNGHMHTETAPHRYGSSINLISGAAYSNDTPEYHCRLLKIPKGTPNKAKYRDIRRAIGNCDTSWEITGDKEFQFDRLQRKLGRNYGNDQYLQQIQKAADDLKNHPEKAGELLKAISDFVDKILSDALRNSVKKTNDQEQKENKDQQHGQEISLSLSLKSDGAMGGSV